MIRELTALGLETLAGEGNFVMTRLPVSDTLIYRHLMKHGVMVRTMTGFRYPNWIRITVSHREPLNAFIEALALILNQIEKQGAQ